jgi:porin
MSFKLLLPLASLACALLLIGGGRAAAAEDQAAEAAPALTYSMVYTADLTSVQGSGVHAGRYLDNLDLVADLDLEKSVGWKGGTLHAYVLNNSGGTPNDVAGTLLGVDNIEVSVPRLRLFEFWLEQDIAGGRASVRGGLYNLNSEFYANDAAGLLIAPAFGIGSELAATGPNGPSIFPSTALGLRLNVKLGEAAYARVAVLDAKAGVMGDPHGVDVSFGDGVIEIVQVGIEAPVKLSAGAWRYSRLQSDIRDLDALGAPAGRRAQGVYLLAEHRLAGSDEGRSVTAFARLGASDGETTPFRGGWQAGLRIAQPFASRPDSAASIGFEQGLLDRKFRDNLRDQAIQPGKAETGIEVTYADRVAKRITLQPDLQWIHNAGGDRAAPDRWVAALRIRIELANGSGK